MQPIGYYFDSDTVLCRSCFTLLAPVGSDNSKVALPNSTAIFRTTERDTPTHCFRCLALIPHTLTEDGKDYVMNAIFEYLVHRRGDLHTIKLWWNQYSDYLTTDDNSDLLKDVMEAL